MPVSKKYSFSLIAFILLFASIPFVLNIEAVLMWSEQYQLIAALALPLMVLVVTVSYLTGQAKIDVEASIGSRGGPK